MVVAVSVFPQIALEAALTTELTVSMIAVGLKSWIGVVVKVKKVFQLLYCPSTVVEGLLFLKSWYARLAYVTALRDALSCLQASSSRSWFCIGIRHVEAA